MIKQNSPWTNGALRFRDFSTPQSAETAINHSHPAISQNSLYLPDFWL
jgi:hypothetical protein